MHEVTHEEEHSNQRPALISCEPPDPPCPSIHLPIHLSHRARSLLIKHIDEQLVSIPIHLGLLALRSIRPVRLPRVLPQPMRSLAVLAVLAALGLRRVGDVLGLAWLAEENTMLDGRRCEGCRIGLLSDAGGLERVLRAAGTGGWGVATELDRASTLDRRSVAIVVGRRFAVILRRSGGARVGRSVAVQVTKDIGILEGRCGRGAERSVNRGIESLAAGAG